MELTCIVRNTQEFIVELDNPTHQTIEYIATVEGEYIHGPDSLVLKPKSSEKYVLTHTPFKVGQFKGYLQLSNQ